MTQPDTVETPECWCFFCVNGRSHPVTVMHAGFHPVTSHLIRAESLDPADRIDMQACNTCGHIQPVPA